MLKNKVIIITGPTASGKSTVAKELCQKFKKCVRIDVDRVKHFVESGFLYNNSIEGKKQWKLCAKNVGMLAKNFAEAGYNVVIEGVLFDWQIVSKILKKDKKFLFLPNEKVLQERNKKREEKFWMSNREISEHLKYFFDKKMFKGFEVIDNSDLKISEVAEKIIN